MSLQSIWQGYISPLSQSLVIKSSINPLVFVDHIYSHVNKPLDPNAWPKIRSDKTSCCPTIFKLSKEHENKWEVGHALQAIIFPLNKFVHQDMDSFVTSNPAWVKQKALSCDN